MRRVTLDGERLQMTGQRTCGMESWRTVRRLAKAGYLRAVRVDGPLRVMEHRLTAAGEAETAARRGRLP